jgi:phosphatidylglycerol---prolipoprotein diacylglyceryl transferase
MEIHALFDGLAWLSAALVMVGLRRWFADAFVSPRRPAASYLIAVVIGAALGAYGLGTLNLWLSGMSGVARSIEGALAGAILAVELYKWRKGIVGRTAALFALPAATGIAVGRVGCYLAGIDDFTYGVPTDLPWGHDFGDGVLRHPVQLYESIAMLAFAALYGVALARRQAFVLENGFALFVLVYAVQRFGIEFLKPYAALVLELTLFQVVSVAMIVYAFVLLRPRNLPDAQRA